VKKSRLLISAIIFSAVWHIFWLSAVTVVVVPKAEKRVKFSSVSFLGPILDRGVMTVSVAAGERTPLEKRYLSYVEDLFIGEREELSGNSYAEARLNDTALFSQDDRVLDLAISGLDGNKLEPGRDIY
jgi:hypothetical protein